MSISVATTVVAPSAPSSVAAPAALPAGAGNHAFLALLETFSSAAPAGDDSAQPPAARAWTDRATLPGTMPASLAGALDAARGGTVRNGTDAPLETDGGSAQPGNPADQTAALVNLVLQVLPLPIPPPLPAVNTAALAEGPATAQASGTSVTTAADTGDRGTRATGVGNATAGSTGANAISQAPGFGLQASADQTNPGARIVTTAPSMTAASGANPAGEAAGVRSGAGGQIASARAGRAAVEGSNIPSQQAAAPSTDSQSASTSGLPAGPKGPALGPVDAKAPADRFRGRIAAEPIPEASAAAVSEAGAVSLPEGASASSGALQFEARSTGEQATRKPGATILAEQGAPISTDLGAQVAATPRDQASIPASPLGATPVEHPAGGAADRRSAAGLRLAAALARSGRAEGPAGAALGPNRVAAQATPKPVDSDPLNVSTPGQAGVNAQGDRVGERLRTEPLTFGAVVSAAEQMPVRAGAAESSDPRAGLASVEPASDLKTNALNALFAAPVGVLAVGSPSSHTVAAAVATTMQPVLDPAAESDLPRQIVQAMRLQWKDGIGDARIRLLPEYLGELSVAIRVEHGSVTAALEASTPSVRHWIESHEPMLRQSLAEQGLHLDRLIVLDEPEQTTPNPDRERRREKGEEPQPRPQSRRRPPADDTTFEVIV